ncbi:PHP domain-containing protein [Tepidimicrobium xylanilyticum]|uniref:PHP domain-containing protein n=1 Tax=Tepidimicrobium xylanilyticum TaxID=1123352 RepID=UPI00264BE672|nr:PHP domain-containing protein [Tepidimicrobium xylanilyticum]GMG95333.1 hypothetical protein EN5CB1_01590 [Tepidimicrobium xylanilyticum]
MKLVGDFHVHTVASGDAFSTIDELSKRGKELGLDVLAITDHGPAMPSSAHRYYFDSLIENVKVSNEVRILPGVEANIIHEDGSLDLPEKTISKLPFVIISFHVFSWNQNDVITNTKALINCINRYNNIKAIAHLNKPYYELDIKSITPLLVEKKIVVELNNKALDKDKDNWNSFKDIILYMEEKGVKFIISSDAHSLEQLGNFNEALNFADYCNLNEENVVNTSLKKLKDYLKIDL